MYQNSNTCNLSDSDDQDVDLQDPEYNASLKLRKT